jgi:anti-sigma28 factor (negative regulator of flagellin synthesis)
LFTQHIKGFTYNDVMQMPTQERRFFIGEKLKEINKQEENMEKMKEQSKSSGERGIRTKKISGEALKTNIKSGNLPLS